MKNAKLLSRISIAAVLLVIGIIVLLTTTPGPDPDPDGDDEGKPCNVQLRMRSLRVGPTDFWKARIHWVGKWDNNQIDNGGPGSTNNFDISMDYDEPPTLMGDKWYSIMTFYNGGLRAGRWSFAYYTEGGTSAATDWITFGISEGKMISFTQGKQNYTIGDDYP